MCDCKYLNPDCDMPESYIDLLLVWGTDKALVGFYDGHNNVWEAYDPNTEFYLDTVEVPQPDYWLAYPKQLPSGTTIS